jgi:riboflavin synthase
MFTGIVEEMGVVEALEERHDVPLWDGTIGTGTQLTIHCSTVLEGAYLGCSICVSGVCLTATELTERAFVVGLSPETLRKSNLGSLRTGDRVNLERAAMSVMGGGRNSGHFVQGHVDDTGTISQRWVDGDSLVLQIQVRHPSLLPYIVKKGFIAVDGTSLTVCEVFPETSEFTVMLVAYTQTKITLPEKQVGDEVNIEVDVLGKYAESAVAGILPRMEALESKVQELESELSQYKAKTGKE